MGLWVGESEQDQSRSTKQKKSLDSTFVHARQPQ